MYPLLAIPYQWDARRTINRLERDDRKHRAEHPGVLAPAAKLRFKVVGPCSIDEFLNAGRKSVDYLETGLQRAGASFATTKTALDWGCGCARSVLAMLEKHPHVSMFGADVDAEAIEWCKAHIQKAHFTATPALPPLPYGDGQFDVVYTISVFTHLDEERQFKWLAELQRVLRPGGVLLATVHGPKAWEGLPKPTVERIRKEGIIFANTSADKGVHPDWYQTTWHTEDYIRSKWSAYFEVLAYLPEGMIFDIADGMKIVQDMVVLRRM
jgi:SAM-dependent methyltransferase